MTQTLVPTATPPRDALTLEAALALALQLAAPSEVAELALALPDVDPIDLPPIAGDEQDAARVRLAASLYLASELESAALLPAAEAFAGVAVTGGVQADLGSAGELVIAFWRQRHERFSVEERHAFFARLFGAPAVTTLAVHAPVNGSFEPLLLGLAEAVYQLEAPPGFRPAPAAELALRVAAAQLATNIGGRTSGIPEPTARMILAAVGAALAIFKEPAAQAALGVQAPWAAVRAAARRYLHEEPAIEAHVMRGKAGLTLLAWLAEAVVTLDPARPLRTVDASVVAAAGSWLQASLALSERDGEGGGSTVRR